MPHTARFTSPEMPWSVPSYSCLGLPGYEHGKLPRTASRSHLSPNATGKTGGDDMSYSLKP